MEDNGFKTLKRWIADHEEQFKTEHYTTSHIVDLAIACGFDRTAIAQWKTSKLFKEAI
jgi:hypothetical protein